MAKKGRSDPAMFGGYNNYDSKGKRTGKSVPNAFGGGYTTYDEKGNKVGRTEPGLFGDYIHYDAKGNKIGKSSPGAFGGYVHYDAKGNKTGSSNPGAFGSYNHDDNTDACYIATCVYGSYDCPEVMVLRRFRDGVLKKNVFGRAFIRCYYAVSPHAVKLFGRYRWFHKFWKNLLDRLIGRIES